MGLVGPRFYVSALFLLLCLALFSTSPKCKRHEIRSTQLIHVTYPSFIQLQSGCDIEGQQNTIEYQLKTNNEYFLQNRSAIITEYVSYFALLTNFSANALMENSDRNVLIETYFPECTHNEYKFQMCQYISGANASTNSAHIKVNTLQSINEACSLSFAGATQYKEYDSLDELGHDILPCETLYSRKIRINGLPDTNELPTCEDFEELFPDAFENMGEKSAKMEVTAKEDQHSQQVWFEWKSGGYLQAKIPIKFLLSFRIRYDTVEDAESDALIPEKSSKFSFRVWKSSPPALMAPEEEDLMRTYHWYQKMLDKFGSFGEYPCGFN